MPDTTGVKPGAQGYKISTYEACRASKLGIVAGALGRYLVVGQVNNLGDGLISKPWEFLLDLRGPHVTGGGSHMEA